MWPRPPEAWLGEDAKRFNRWEYVLRFLDSLDNEADELFSLTALLVDIERNNDARISFLRKRTKFRDMGNPGDLEECKNNLHKQTNRTKICEKLPARGSIPA